MLVYLLLLLPFIYAAYNPPSCYSWMEVIIVTPSWAWYILLGSDMVRAYTPNISSVWRLFYIYIILIYHESGSQLGVQDTPRGPKRNLRGHRLIKGDEKERKKWSFLGGLFSHFSVFAVKYHLLLLWDVQRDVFLSDPDQSPLLGSWMVTVHAI